MKKKISVDECDTAFALTFLLTTLVNISLPALSISYIFLLLNCWKGVSRWTKICLRGIEALKL